MRNLRRAPLGVDLDSFHPSLRDVALRERWVRPGELLLVHCGRLSPEKRVDRSVEALAALRRRGVPATLVIAGDGPSRQALERRAAGLPVEFIGFVDGRREVARLLATADVNLSPGPIETFGLAALETLASGTPVVAGGEGALGEVVGDAGVIVTVPDDATPAEEGERYADAVLELAGRPEADRRAAARARAELFSWPAAVAAWLDLHRAGAPEGTPATARAAAESTSADAVGSSVADVPVSGVPVSGVPVSGAPVSPALLPADRRRQRRTFWEEVRR